MLSMLVLSATFCAASTVFFFNDPATTEIYTLSLHDALPISSIATLHHVALDPLLPRLACALRRGGGRKRSEEHTSELQSQSNLVCRLLLEKKKISTSKPTGLPSRPTWPKSGCSYMVAIWMVP